MPSARRAVRPPPAGYSGTPLARKLGIRPGCRLYLRGAPDNYAALVAPLPEGVELVGRIGAATDMLHVFATRRAELERALRAGLAAMRADASIWVSWPKKASGVPSEITEDTVRELAVAVGLVDVKVCAVDATWSALKLVVRKNARAHWPRRRRSA
jgi:hypothetical protein